MEQLCQYPAIFVGFMVLMTILMYGGALIIAGIVVAGIYISLKSETLWANIREGLKALMYGTGILIGIGLFTWGLGALIKWIGCP